MKLNKTIKDKYDAIGRAKQALHVAIMKRYPIGATVIYRKGVGARLCGTVVDHDKGERLKIRAERTNKVYWIEAASTVEP